MTGIIACGIETGPGGEVTWREDTTRGGSFDAEAATCRERAVFKLIYVLSSQWTSRRARWRDGSERRGKTATAKQERGGRRGVTFAKDGFGTPDGLLVVAILMPRTELSPMMGECQDLEQTTRNRPEA